MPENNSSQDSFVVIGEGPAGWAAVFELLKQGCTDITITDKRSEQEVHNRYQHLLIDTDAIEFLFKEYNIYSNDYTLAISGRYTGNYHFKLHRKSNLSQRIKIEDSVVINPYTYFQNLVLELGKDDLNVQDFINIKTTIDLKFFACLNNRECTIQTPVLQYYLQAKAMIKARELSNPNTKVKIKMERCDVKSIEAAVSEKKWSLICNGTPNKFGPFDHVLVAAGAHGDVLTIPLRDNSNSNKSNEKSTASVESKKSVPVVAGSEINNCSIHMRLNLNVPDITADDKRKILQAINKRQEIFPHKNTRLHVTRKMKDMGWSKKRPPVNFMVFDPVEVSFYMAGEFPQQSKNQDKNVEREKLESWAREIICAEFPELRKVFVKIGKENVDQKKKVLGLFDQTKNCAVTFELNPGYVEEPIIKMPNADKYVMPIGDSYFSPNYYLGHGSTIALFTANAAASCFKDGKFNSITPYTNQAEKLLKDYYIYVYIYSKLLSLNRYGLFKPLAELIERVAGLKNLMVRSGTNVKKNVTKAGTLIFRRIPPIVKHNVGNNLSVVPSKPSGGNPNPM